MQTLVEKGRRTINFIFTRKLNSQTTGGTQEHQPWVTGYNTGQNTGTEHTVRQDTELQNKTGPQYGTKDKDHDRIFVGVWV